MEVEIFRFPNELCIDRGRAINQRDPGWEKTLTDMPKELLRLLGKTPQVSRLQNRISHCGLSRRHAGEYRHDVEVGLSRLCAIAGPPLPLLVLGAAEEPSHKATERPPRHEINK
jgi:hypothetical protein